MSTGSKRTFTLRFRHVAQPLLLPAILTMTATPRLSASHEMQLVVMSLDQLTFRLYAFTLLTNGIDAKTHHNPKISRLSPGTHSLIQGSSGETLSASPCLTLVSCCCYCKNKRTINQPFSSYPRTGYGSNSFTTSFSCSPPDLTLFSPLKAADRQLAILQ